MATETQPLLARVKGQIEAVVLDHAKTGEAGEIVLEGGGLVRPLGSGFLASHGEVGGQVTFLVADSLVDAVRAIKIVAADKG